MASKIFARSMAMLTRPRQTNPVIISYPTLLSDPLSLTSAIEQGFGSSPNALGIVVVKDLPDTFPATRERLLRLAAKFAALKEDSREKYVDESTYYSFGWSHGKEIMNGKPDLLKGSYYANPTIDEPTVSEEQKKSYPEYYGRNIWPAKDEAGVEGFEDAFKDLGRFVFKVGCELAAACQPFASKHLADGSFSIPKLISTSQTTKARLLHYFPPSPDAPVPAEDEPVDSWCGFHLDHSVLTGLCSALYLRDGTDAVSAPSPSAGLYIKARDGTLTQVKIPADCLAFQTGEALELATGGRLRATPHCVRAGGVGLDAHCISRETFALFMQPDTHVLVGENETFGQFSKRVFAEHYDGNKM